MPSKNSESPVITEKLSVGLKNISKGLWAEEVVKQKFLNEGFELLHQRLKMPYGEVDLVFQKKKKVFLVEVKFLHNSWMAFERLAHRQKQRLALNVVHHRGYALGILCFVDKDKNISTMNIFD